MFQKLKRSHFDACKIQSSGTEFVVKGQRGSSMMVKTRFKNQEGTNCEYFFMLNWTKDIAHQLLKRSQALLAPSPWWKQWKKCGWPPDCFQTVVPEPCSRCIYREGTGRQKKPGSQASSTGLGLAQRLHLWCLLCSAKGCSPDSGDSL